MFEMKYDKNGNPIPQPELAQPAEQPEAQAQEQDEPAQEEPEVQQEEAQQEEAPQENTSLSDKGENLRRLREKSERLERERDEAIKFARQLKSQYDKPAQVKEIEQEENWHINPDDLVEGKHLSRYDKKIQDLEKQLKSYEQQSKTASIEARLNREFPDYNKIVSEKTVTALREADPDIAEAIYHTPDLYKKAALTYKMIKQMGIGKEDAFVKDKQRAMNNSSKPKPVNTISPQEGNTPLSRANAFADGLTDDLKAQLRKEMEQARKGF